MQRKRTKEKNVLTVPLRCWNGRGRKKGKNKQKSRLRESGKGVAFSNSKLHQDNIFLFTLLYSSFQTRHERIFFFFCSHEIFVKLCKQSAAACLYCKLELVYILYTYLKARKYVTLRKLRRVYKCFLKTYISNKHTVFILASFLHSLSTSLLLFPVKKNYCREACLVSSYYYTFSAFLNIQI